MFSFQLEILLLQVDIIECKVISYIPNLVLVIIHTGKASLNKLNSIIIIVSDSFDLIFNFSRFSFLAYSHNQPYPYGTGQGIPYAGVGISNGIPYMDQGNYYNEYYPSQGGNLGYLPGGIIPRLARFGNIIPRPVSNLGEQTNKPASGNSTNIQ